MRLKHLLPRYRRSVRMFRHIGREMTQKDFAALIQESRNGQAVIIPLDAKSETGVALAFAHTVSDTEGLKNLVICWERGYLVVQVSAFKGPFVWSQP